MLAASAALLLAALAEWLHTRRVRHVATLAFGPSGRPAGWARGAPAARVLAFAALAWGLSTLFLAEPRRYSIGAGEGAFSGDPKHILVVLDVSPSMHLVDAGPSKKESRTQRARELMESFFERIPLEEYRVSVVAFYNGAKAVVIDTKDFEVVRNILGDLPLNFAFKSGKTKLFDGLTEAAKVAKDWNPRSTTVVIVSDGDTVPATGMPQMPDSVRSVIVCGVGDPQVGKFIDGRHSRQDVPMLKQIAARLHGSFHNGNDKQLASSLIADATGNEEEGVFEKLTRREYALIACALGSLALAGLPFLLHFLGTRWRPGSRRRGAKGQVAEGIHGPRRPSADGEVAWKPAP
ncbi:MAG: VWA domain-containing protein [Planctomycetes bacterium]|nr:VWA domain-containing protein [Planctomycetota bacterium]